MTVKDRKSKDGGVKKKTRAPRKTWGSAKAYTWDFYMKSRFLFPITTKAAYEKALKIADVMVPRADLGKAEVDYLQALVTLIEEYEAKQQSIHTADLTPLEVLKHLVDENGLTGSDLGRIIGQRQLGAKILSGARQLSKTHIKRLSEYFAVSPTLFL